MPWRTEVRDRLGILGPESMSDHRGDGSAPESPSYVPWDAGEGDPDDPLDIAVAATRREVLPLHGLDPMRDR
jgi:acetoin utilization protein AcuC